MVYGGNALRVEQQVVEETLAALRRGRRRQHLPARRLHLEWAPAGQQPAGWHVASHLAAVLAELQWLCWNWLSHIPPRTCVASSVLNVDVQQSISWPST